MSSKGFSALIGRALRETGAALKRGGEAEVSSYLTIIFYKGAEPCRKDGKLPLLCDAIDSKCRQEYIHLIFYAKTKTRFVD